jgi:hypothetical protein
VRTRSSATSLLRPIAYIIARFLKPGAARVVTVIFTATATTADTAASPLIPARIVAVTSLVVTIVGAIIIAATAAAPVIVAPIGATARGRAASPGPVIIVRAEISVERAASATVIPAFLPVTRAVFTATAAASLARRASAV